MLISLPIKFINIIHIFVTGVILLLLGIYKNNSPKILYYILGVLALSIPILINLPNTNMNYWNIIKITHYFIILPFLLYIAYKQNNLSLQMYDMLLLLAIIIIVYHSYKLYKRMK